MAWPFTSVNEPNLDTGTGQIVPTVAGVVTASVAWLIGAHFHNGAAVSRTVTITNTAGDVLCGPLEIPAGADMPYEWPFRPTTGVKWVADGNLVTGHIWGYL
jgi:hypothetical protein